MRLLPLFFLATTLYAAGGEYAAADGTFRCRIPMGWTERASSIGTAPIHLMEFAGSEDKILIGVSPSGSSGLNELGQQAVQLTMQLVPGLSLSGQPRRVRNGDAAALEMTYSGAIQAWQMVTIREGQAAGVTGLARPHSSARTMEAAREVAASLQLAAAVRPDNSNLSRMAVGRWTWSHATDRVGSTSRQLTLFPNGRYQYQATTFIANMPADIDPTTTVTGTYRVQGNQLIGRTDRGEQAQFTIQMVENGKGMRINGELYIRE